MKNVKPFISAAALPTREICQEMTKEIQLIDSQLAVMERAVIDDMSSRDIYLKIADINSKLEKLGRSTNSLRKYIDAMNEEVSR